MAFAEALHHSAGPREKVVERREEPEGEVRETHDALRGQKRPLLLVVAVPQGRPEAAARVSAGVPSLALAVLAEDTVHASALAFLTQRALEAAVEAEEEMVQGLETNRDVVLFTGRGMVSVHDGAGWSPRGTGDVQLTRHSSGDATFLLMDEVREVLCYCYVVHSLLVVLSRWSVRWRAQLCTDDEPVDAHVLLCVCEELLFPVPFRRPCLVGDGGVRGLVRQWIQNYSLQRPCRLMSTRKVGFFWKLTSGFVPGFSLRLVRQWIHIASVYASVSLPEEHEKIRIFLGDDFWICSRFFIMLGYILRQFTQLFLKRLTHCPCSSLLGSGMHGWFCWCSCFMRRVSRCGHYFYGLLHLAVTCVVLVCLRSSCVDFSSGRRLLDLFPYSALIGSTVDTCSCQFTEADVFSDKGVDMPVVMLDSLVQTVQRPVVAPQVQFLVRL